MKADGNGARLPARVIHWSAFIFEGHYVTLCPLSQQTEDHSKGDKKYLGTADGMSPKSIGSISQIHVVKRT